jgi:glutamate carboxypeptidase
MLDRIGERTAGGLAWLETQGEAMEKLLAELVSENSFTGNAAGGNRVAAGLRAAFESSELVCEAQASPVFAHHLLFSTAAEGPAIVLVGHLDTVFPPGAFEGYRRDGPWARGPGVLDMKGGLLVAGFALRALSRVGALAALPIRFVVVSDEEVGSPESRLLLQRIGDTAACGLVFEAGRTADAIVTQRKGTGSMFAVARGRAAHAGNLHHEGVNAIWALARFIDRAHALTDYARGTTVNVGTIAGGQSKNAVPDHAKAEIDLRFVTAEEGHNVLAELERAAEAAARSIAGASIELSGGISRPPMERTAASLALFAEYAACARASGLGDGEAPLAGGGSDANTLSAVGVPCIDGLGPRGAGYHTKDERIEIATMIPKAAALFRFLMGRLAPPGLSSD